MQEICKIEKIKEFVENKGGKLISDIYTNNRTKLELRCKNGHIFYLSWGMLRIGYWCLICAKEKEAFSRIKIAKAIGRQKGFVCRSEKCYSVGEKLDFVCSKGHFFKISISKLKSGRGCSRCAGNIRHSHEFVKNIIDGYGGILLSSDYKNNITALDVKCKKCETIWHPQFCSIQKGEWCPICSAQKTQKLLFDIIKDIFKNKDIHYNYNKFLWLKTKKQGRLQIDILIKDLKIAIEYDGEQHFKPIEFWGGSERFEDTKRRDLLKNKLIKKHKEDIEHFIRFNYKEKITKEYVIDKLINSGIKKDFLCQT